MTSAALLALQHLCYAVDWATLSFFFSLSLLHSLSDRPPPLHDVTRAPANAPEVDLAVFAALTDFISGLHHVCVAIRPAVGIGASSGGGGGSSGGAA